MFLEEKQIKPDMFQAENIFFYFGNMFEINYYNMNYFYF